MAKISPSILSLEFFKNSIYLRVRSRERFVNPQLLKQLAVYKIKEELKSKAALSLTHDGRPYRFYVEITPKGHFLYFNIAYHNFTVNFCFKKPLTAFHQKRAPPGNTSDALILNSVFLILH